MSESDRQPILYDVDEGVAVISFNRPEKKNALTRAMYRNLKDDLIAARRDNDVRVIVLHGQGESYTSGNDLLDFMKSPPKSQDTPVFRFLQALLGSEKPILAAVRGNAIGIGTTMLLHCDVVYASPSAKFKLPFVDLGLCPEAASTFLLPRMMGHQRAAELLMFGESFDANTAYELGLINRVIDDEKLDEFVLQRAKLLATKPANALRLTKRLLRAPLKDQVHRSLLAEGTEFVECLRSPEAAEAFQKFFAQRTKGSTASD